MLCKKIYSSIVNNHSPVGHGLEYKPPPQPVREAVFLECVWLRLDSSSFISSFFSGFTKVDSRDLKSGAEQVQFTVRMRELGSGQHNIFCCLYKDQEGRYSVFSSYLELEAPKGL